uniref:Cox2 n=1 Tax=Senna occidentalis TaxID=126820 RepID=A0A2Z4HGP6_SENOC|nr:Cox2 [Senna occidentalis]AWW13980.1 Cox2 [Senna occidentalis]
MKLLTIAPCDAAEPWQLGFQDAATPMMQGIIDLHHDIFFFLILILVFVSRILVRALWHFHYQKNPIPQRIVHGTTIEILRTCMFLVLHFASLLLSLTSLSGEPVISFCAGEVPGEGGESERSSIPILRAPSPGGAIEVFEIPESPASVSPPPQDLNPSIEEGDGVEVGRTTLPLETEGPPYRGKDPAVKPTGYVPPGEGEQILFEEYSKKVVRDFRSLYEDAFGKPVPSYPRCRAAISQRASCFLTLLDLHRGLVERGPDGQGGRENPVFRDLLQVVQETKSDPH